MGGGYSFFWISGDTFPNKKQNFSLVMRKNSLYATRSPTSSFLVFAVQKSQTESGKLSLPTERELSSRHLCLHTTDQSKAQDSANLQQYALLRNKLVMQVVIRATESFNLHCNNVARHVEEKCCSYYRTLHSSLKTIRN